MLKKETLKLISETPNFIDIFSICIGKIYTNQLRLKEYLGNYNSWNTNIMDGTLQIDNRIFDVEYIGTTSNEDNYWYSSELEDRIPDEYVSIMMDVRKMLETLNFNEIANGKILIQDNVDGHNLATIYTAFASQDVLYFKGSGNVSIYMFIKNLPGELFKKINPIELPKIIIDIISNFDVNHSLIVKALLIENDIEYSEEGNNLIIKLHENSILKIQYDENNKIIGISGDLNK